MSETPIVVQRSDGTSDNHSGRISNWDWVVDENGTLHIRTANHEKVASYAYGAWVRVERGTR